MRRMTGMGLWALLTFATVGTPALASSPACYRSCEQDAKQCKDICTKHAGSVVGKCSTACVEEKNSCMDECKNEGRGSRQSNTSREKEAAHEEEE
ncbi:hypothetical protein D7Y13_10185 [Corallococcus praedator]|uniref:Uncharacterized protein n=2 Tax=Myxococcaceae TaxID=31 RepID=A0ABX9QLD9_9BACT|nr:hypothetical protein D7X75_09975 [Corallococcus sp. CA031C]RKI11978.1 hypothetical protein D7Y13_10185 [Corallococcus praedator]